MIWTFRIAIAIALLWAAWRAYRMFQTGSIRVYDADEPVLLLARQERPLAYWSFVIFFYAVLFVIAVSVTSL
ncbi:hypothetical protein PX554_03845 [Sphingomonas sp. H39-1-10]|uniref:hypothetical protein n=1 Tax=Sphingomonas pollutisoli TaxID=3030829 RepID=UPI0023B8C6A1|nr:hypothetical protein [Sphingomonas pollutisoli]MDF0487252.1 hypothetical protein [Sphingomonas pollutisoli]